MSPPIVATLSLLELFEEKAMPRLGAERLQQKREKLEAQLQAIREQEEAEQEHRFALVGRTLLDHAESDEAFHQQMLSILDARLKKKRDRALVGLAPRNARSRQAASGAHADPAPTSTSAS